MSIRQLEILSVSCNLCKLRSLDGYQKFENLTRVSQEV